MKYDNNGAELAIIGLAGRFPGAKNIDDFWSNLKNGVESISIFLDPELQESGRESNRFCETNKTIKAGGVMDDVDLFDASFFGYSPREAEVMDPQHRIFLECAWEALENAGYDCAREEGSIGVYAGVSLSTYARYNLYPNSDITKSIGALQSLFAVDKDFAPTRVSYKLNLKGPSVSIQTACSSSLVAVHIAGQSLLSGECDMALAAGITVKVPQTELTLYSEEISSLDGHCRAFDAKANGTIGGNGIGVVVLKRFEDAIADRDHIYAVIKGSAINNDGSSKVGYSAPSEDGQARAIRSAQIMAEVEPGTITYLEAQGMGTPLGDPIEIAATTQAFRASTDKTGYCAIGSVKTNVGHLESAAGIAGLIKTILALEHKLLPPTLNFETPNPHIDFANSPFYVNCELSEWKRNGAPRRAGVNSFGFGGTNAHVILEEAPVVGASSPSRAKQLLLLSAKTSSALETATTNLANHLKQHPELNLADVAYTLQVGRQAFNYRQMILAEGVEEALNALEASPQRVFKGFTESSDRAVVFMFTGQGAQYVNMTREIYQSEAIFRQQCDRCCELLKPHLGLDLRQLLYPTEADAEKAAQQLQQTAITQLALFVIEYALAQLWMSWGVHPVAMIGHSIGEYVAACLADVFSLEEALALVAARGQLMQQLPPGSMLAVPLSEKEVQPWLAETLSLATINGTSSCVVSGVTEAIETLQNQLASAGVECKRLHTSHAFHSEMMEPILEPFQERIKQVNLKPPQIPYVSNLTGTWITAQEATDPSYWTAHLRQTVRFADGLQAVLKQPAQVLLEVGPGRTLSKLAKQHSEKRSEQVVLTSVRHPQEKQSDVELLLNTLGQLWLAGVQVDWSGFYAHEQRDRLPLPTYPFERQHYWIDPPAQSASSRQTTLEKKHDIADWFYIPSWKRSIALASRSKEAQDQSYNLVFIDESGLGAQLVKRLEQQGQDVITVKVGSEFTQLSKGVYTLNPQQSNDYNTLLRELLAQQKIPKSIVHLWTVTSNEYAKSGLEEVDKAQEQGFYSLLFLAQALGKQKLTNEFQIVVISNNLQSVVGDEILSPEKATLLGPVKVIGQEYPNIYCRSIDILLPSTESGQEEKLIDQLLTEITTPTFDQIIAYRRNKRWVQTFEPVQLDEVLEEAPCLKEGGVYLITGGLGSIGLVMAEYLAKTVQAKLILTGRSALPDRGEWSQWLATYDETDSVNRKLRKVLELEKLGAEVWVVSADVASVQEMTNLIAQAELRCGQLNGVIHAAGIFGENLFCAIEQIEKTDCEQQFQAKVKGLLVLKQVLKEKKLDFCLLMSSLSSVLGGLGFVAYSAANIFMDAFTYQHNQADPVPWISVNWDIWQVGEERKKKQSESLGTSLAKLAIKPEEGINVWQRVLSWRILNQIIVSTGELQERIKQSINLEFLRSKATPKKLNSFSLYSRPDLQNTYVSPSNEIEQVIAKIWQEVLGIKQVGVHDNFFEIGGDSLLATQVISRVHKTLHTELSVNSMFEIPTVAGISEQIVNLRLITQKQQTSNTAALGKREEGVL